MNSVDALPPATSTRAVMYAAVSLQVERPQLAAQPDALLELAQRRDDSAGRRAPAVRPARSAAASSVGGLDVGQQPDLLEQLVRQALRLVDDQRGAITARCVTLAAERARARCSRPVFDAAAAGASSNSRARNSRNSVRVSVGLFR